MTAATPTHGRSRYRFLRYLAVGGLNTAFGFAAYSGLILAGAPFWLALFLANIAGILFNFVTTGTLVFRASLTGRLTRFIAAYLCLYGANLLLLSLLRRWIAGEIYAQALLALPMAALAYVLINRFVFNEAPRIAGGPSAP